MWAHSKAASTLVRDIVGGILSPHLVSKLVTFCGDILSPHLAFTIVRDTVGGYCLSI